jgi:hypothetical protein
MTVQNQNLRQETDSAVDCESQKIGLVKASIRSGRTERLEDNKATCAIAGSAEIPCIRESNGSQGLSFFERVILCGLDAKMQAARVRFSPGIHGLIGIVLAALVLTMAGRSASAQAPVSETLPIRTTVVVFADQPLQEAQWSGLFRALRSVMTTGGAETEFLGEGAEFVRGDSVAAGFRVQSAIVVYLHGDCNLEPLPRRTPSGVPLGWVWKVDGRIEPFAHVDCTRIGQVLGLQALGMNAKRRNAVMAGAMARVIVHEWIHIAAQSSSHAESGIEKAQYGVADLTAGEKGQTVAQIRKPWRLF